MHTALILALSTQAPAMGAYRLADRTVYVGIYAEPPDHPTVEYYDSKTHRLGSLEHVSGNRYRSTDAPSLTFKLNSPSIPIREKSFVVDDAQGTLGASLWYALDARHRSTVVLVQGADDSTRQMGFLIPYYVAHGLNVVTYDQRGTGKSVGNWRYTGPQAKADDVLALLLTVETDPRVDPRRIGVWAASNGGWVAPIVATHFPLAFMILKSADSETIADNVLYEIEADLRENPRFSAQQILDAMRFERTMFGAMQTNSNWDVVGQALDSAKSQPWFSHMRIPPGMTVPPPAPMLSILQASLIYDPTATLTQVRTPLLAIFGAMDRNVNASASEAGYRKAFKQSGMTDLTIVTFPNAGHLLVASPTGYEDQPSLPVRYVGYPEVMINWLRVRNFTKP